MRIRCLLLLIITMPFADISAQDSSIEQLSSCGHAAAVTELMAWGDGLLQVSTCNGESITQQTVAKTDLMGEVAWEIDFFGWGSQFRFAPDSSFWILETGGCDFLDAMYHIRHFSKQGELLEDFEGMTIIDEGDEIYVDPGFMTYVNDSILAIQAWNSLNYFNTNQLIFESGPDISSGNLLNSGVHSFGVNELALCFADSLVLLNYDGESSSYSDGSDFKRIWPGNQHLLVYKDDELVQLDAQLNLINSYQLTSGTELIDLSVGDQIDLLLLNAGAYSCISLSGEFDELNDFALDQTDLFIPNCLLRKSGHYLTGGFNPNQLSSQAVYKVYDGSGSSVNYERDIELLSIEALGYSNSLMGEFNGTLIYTVTALYVNLEVRNNSAVPIAGFTCYALQEGIPGLCGQSVVVRESNQVIQPGETYVFPFGNFILGFANIDEGVEEYQFDFERCLWTQAPDGLMDRVPENDNLCHDFSGIITDVEENDSWTSSFSYRSGINQAVLESNLSCNWAIYDLSGRIIMHGQSSPGVSLIELNALSPGVYLFRYFSGDDNLTEKFLKH